MRFKLAAALAVLFLFASTTSAIAPTKPQEITNFGPVVITDLDIRDNWGTPRPSMGRPTPEIEEAEPIIIDLTTPKPEPHTKEVPPENGVLPTVKDARSYALNRIGSTQFSCLDKLFERESGWNPLARNSSSGAYGIPQALPGSKMAIIADDWRTNPVTQVKWGLRYIDGRYGTACNAWGHFLREGWY